MQITRRSLAFAGAGALCATAGLGAAGPAAAQSSEAVAVAQAVDALTRAMTAADRRGLEAATAEALSYGHSGGKIETKAEYIDVIANKKTIYKSIDLADQSIAVAGNDAIVRHIFTANTETGGQASTSKIGVLQVWTKQDGSWKLLARQAYRL